MNDIGFGVGNKDIINYDNTALVELKFQWFILKDGTL